MLERHSKFTKQYVKAFKNGLLHATVNKSGQCMFIYMAHLSTTDQSAAQHSIKQLG